MITNKIGKKKLAYELFLWYSLYVFQILLRLFTLCFHGQ